MFMVLRLYLCSTFKTICFVLFSHFFTSLWISCTASYYYNNYVQDIKIF